jgi:hypothetical protein
MAQVTADATTFAGFTVADLTSAEALAIHQRMVSGMAEMVTAVADIAVATGVIPA